MKLVICEKPSQAKSIAAVLNAKQRQDGFVQGGEWLVSWCFGHLVELAPPGAYGEQYKRWSRAMLPILPDVWKYEASKDKAKQLTVLRSLMNRDDVDSVVCATDAGREGELIFRLVYDYCKCSKPVQRLWVSSMTDAAIREGFAKLRPGTDYDNLYRAALCRAKADFLIGINATRLFTCLYGSSSPLNVGRVQSPTLALIVAREEAVRGFIPEPFYTPEIGCGSFVASGEKLKDAEAAEAVRAATDGRNAVVLSVDKVRKTAAPPKLYDLTTLQRDANRLFGYTARQVLDYAQSLYEKAVISYPRVDSRYLTSDMRDTADAIVAWIQRDMEFKDGADFVPDIGRIINDGAVTDHHAIIPTDVITKADLAALPAGECDILNLIACRLLCAVAPVHVYETAAVVLECGGYSFTAKGKTVITDGWKAVDAAFKASLKDRPEAGDDDAALPELAEGQVFPCVTAAVREGKTSPPRRYTEDTLLAAMETAGAEDMPESRVPAKSRDFVGEGGATEWSEYSPQGECSEMEFATTQRKGLGTPATRAAIIEKLIKSGFVERRKKALLPTENGCSLIAVKFQGKQE